jgi:uncharacterized protein (TIGR02246 family)
MSDPYGLNLVNKWAAALSHGRLEELLDMYCEKAVLVSTFGQEILRGREALSGYFTALMEYPNLEVSVHEEINQNTHEGHRAISGHYTFSWGESAEDMTHVDARYTFAIEEDDGGWEINTHHSSEQPKE